jgi:hypothetical protein
MDNEFDEESKARLGVLFTDEEAASIILEHAIELKKNGSAILTQRVQFAIQSIGTNATARIYKLIYLGE